MSEIIIFFLGYGLGIISGYFILAIVISARDDVSDF